MHCLQQQATGSSTNASAGNKHPHLGVWNGLSLPELTTCVCCLHPSFHCCSTAKRCAPLLENTAYTTVVSHTTHFDTCQHGIQANKKS
jgi:hypothetical protein